MAQFPLTILTYVLVVNLEKTLQNIIIKEVMAAIRNGFMGEVRHRVLVCGGAIGTMLYTSGAFLNRACEELNRSDPEAVADIHRAYVDAGADVVETNTFSANRLRLESFGLRDRLTELNATDVALARDAAGDRAYVAAAVHRYRSSSRGGYCGTTPDHIKAIKKVISAVPCGGETNAL